VAGYLCWCVFRKLTTAGTVVTSLAIASGNTLEAIAGAWLVNRFADGKNVFDRPQGVFKFTLAIAISAVLSPSFGVTSLALEGLCRVDEIRRDLDYLVGW
jgi:integral membrane sensor domain MASE1